VIIITETSSVFWLHRGKQHDEFNLIFPWAEYDLHDYWRQVNPNPSPKEHQDNLSWLAEQCRGLADGLAYIHRYPTASFRSLLHLNSSLLTSFTKVPTPDSKEVCQLFGRHGDIKPENILWFSGPRPFTENYKGILKITDFGIAEFSTKPAVDRKRRGDTPNSATCCAPEIDLPVQVGGGLINPSYDVWALGCVYLELITWWLGAWEYVEKFAPRRLMPDLFHWLNSRLPLSSDKFFTVQWNSHTGG
jgi:serine/threonine protein kinase